MRYCFSKAIVAFILFVAATESLSQNVIIENEYVRAGVNLSTGTLGSGGSTRPGLQYDNTGTRTFPCASCQGDYLTPGTPFEGFTVRLEDSSGTLVRTYTNNNTGSRSITTGAWVGTPTASSATWSATTSDFTITNNYSLPSGQRYIDINTGITANVAIGRLYFGRFIDPDAMPMTGDTSATDNVLGYGAIPRRNVAFAEATTSRYALGLYSAAANVGAGIGGGANNWTTNPVIYYNGYSPYTSGGATVDYGRGDVTIGLGFLVNNVAVGDIVNFQYAYIFGPNAFGAANYAITGGAGGGTAGTVPGGGTLVDVGSATSAASSGGSSAPTVVSTATSTIAVSDTRTVNTSLPVVVASLAHHTPSETAATQTVARETTTNTTTPYDRTVTTRVRTTTTWSDGTTTYTDAAPTSVVTVENNVDTNVVNDSFSGRIDQQAKLATLNAGINRSLNMDPFRMDVYTSADGEKSVFLRGGRQTTGMGDGYSAVSNMYNIGGDVKVEPNWRVGAQYSQFNTTITGTDSTTTQGKVAGGLYSIYTFDDGHILSTNLGYARNNIATNRSVGGEFNNAYTTNGTDTWVSNRLYVPTLPVEQAEVRPYVGYTFGTTRKNGYTESGDVQTARTVDGVINSTNYAEAGVRVAKAIDEFTVSGDVSRTNNGYRNTEVGVAFSPAKDQSIGIYSSKQQKDDIATNSWFIRGMMRF
jgi:hypothetical protein